VLGARRQSSWRRARSSDRSAADSGCLPSVACSASPTSIQRLQGGLTVPDGESAPRQGSVARAIHADAARREMFLPRNCTSATRRRPTAASAPATGGFTGAVADLAGVIRTAAGGTIFPTDRRDPPIDVQPKFLRFLEQGEILAGRRDAATGSTSASSRRPTSTWSTASRRASSARISSTASASSASTCRRSAIGAKRFPT
jgi:transcriptional regulator of acetoin/glycerol metabolism